MDGWMDGWMDGLKMRWSVNGLLLVLMLGVEGRILEIEVTKSCECSASQPLLFSLVQVSTEVSISEFGNFGLVLVWFLLELGKASGNGSLSESKDKAGNHGSRSRSRSRSIWVLIVRVVANQARVDATEGIIFDNLQLIIIEVASRFCS